jgi:hypothetical protein
MLIPRLQPRIAAVFILLAAGAIALSLNVLTGANHGEIHAHCEGDRPVVTSRPAGSEHVRVVCRKGLPEFMVEAEPVPVYDPITEELPRSKPPDHASWVTLALNNHPLIIPYDAARGVQEPGAYLTARGRVLIPVRFFTEGFGGTVRWNGADQSVTMRMPGRAQVLKVWVGRNEAAVNGKPERLDQPAVLFQDRVFVPTRFLAEGFGAAVEWDGPHNHTWVYMDGITCASRLYCGEVK